MIKKPIHEYTKLLNLLKPLIKPGILIKIFAVNEESIPKNSITSHIGGVPFHFPDEIFPISAFGKPMNFNFQVNTAEFNELNLPKGLFVVYTDNNNFNEINEIRFYPEYKFSCLRKHNIQNQNSFELIEKINNNNSNTNYLPSESLISNIIKSETNILFEINKIDNWQLQYSQLMEQFNFNKNLFNDHIGGWHQTYEDRKFMPNYCKICNSNLDLIIQFEFGDWTKSLWCCKTHPHNAQFAVHK